MMNYGRQSIDEADIAAVVDVLRGDWLTQGPAIERFEAAVAEYTGARHAVAFSSGTAALHGAAHAAGLGPGDVVATSPLTFMASANAARFVGARPALIDVDPSNFNIDVAKVSDDIDAVIPVHFAGLPVDLSSTPAHWPTIVIEDAAHALGAQTPDGPVGNCARSLMCCFSFHPVKPVTTGEGGVVTTNDDELSDTLRRFRSHGIIRRPENGRWHYEITELGFNYRMTDIQAALGASQMMKLESFINRRNELAERYRYLLADFPVELAPQAPEGFRHGYHLFPILVEDRRRVFDGLRDSGIGVQVHYVPIHHHPISQDVLMPAGGLPRCDEIYERILSLPIHPGLTDDEQNQVVHHLRRLLPRA